MASFASIALNLAPLAADMVGKILNMKKEGKAKNDLQARIEKLENYEVEQANLINKLIHKVEYLQVRQRKLQTLVIAAIVFSLVSLIFAAVIFFTSISAVNI